MNAQLGRLPAVRDVAGGTSASKLTGVNVWFGMTAVTGTGRAGKSYVAMTPFTGNLAMRTVQDKKETVIGGGKAFQSPRSQIHGSALMLLMACDATLLSQTAMQSGTGGLLGADGRVTAEAIVGHDAGKGRVARQALIA